MLKGTAILSNCKQHSEGKNTHTAKRSGAGRGGAERGGAVRGGAVRGGAERSGQQLVI
jgi:hypothetical protein